MKKHRHILNHQTFEILNRLLFTNTSNYDAWFILYNTHIHTQPHIKFTIISWNHKNKINMTNNTNNRNNFPFPWIKIENILSTYNSVYMHWCLSLRNSFQLKYKNVYNKIERNKKEILHEAEKNSIIYVPFNISIKLNLSLPLTHSPDYTKTPTLQ